MPRNVLISAMLGSSVLLLTSLGMYDRFISTKGGIFCSTLTDENYKKMRFADERVCVGSGVDLRSRSLKHMGDESMYLLKNIMTPFSTCNWIDDSIYIAIIDVDGRKFNIEDTSGCNIYKSVHIEKR